MDFSGFHWGEVLVAALSAFVWGGLWYGPLVGRAWQRLNGLSDERMAQTNMPLIFCTAFVLNFFLAMMMSLFIEVVMMLGSGALIGALFGAFLAAIFVIPTFGVNYLFARRPLLLYVIDAGYMLTQFAIMGAIMGAWL